MKDPRIWRLSLGSSLLVLTQISAVAFVVLFLHDERGLTDAAAGAVLAAIQIVGGLARIAVGRWSDRSGTRVRPLRALAAAIAASWLCLPLSFDASNALLIALLVTAGALAVSWNGLSFTAAAEFAGARRSGTAIGLQQTLLFAAAAVAAPLFGTLVEASSWRISFALLALPPAGAWLAFAPLTETRRR